MNQKDSIQSITSAILNLKKKSSHDLTLDPNCLAAGFQTNVHQQRTHPHLTGRASYSSAGVTLNNPFSDVLSLLLYHSLVKSTGLVYFQETLIRFQIGTFSVNIGGQECLDFKNSYNLLRNFCLSDLRFCIL